MEDSGSLTVNGIRINPDVLCKDSIAVRDARCGAVCCSGGVWLKNDGAPRIHAWAREMSNILPAVAESRPGSNRGNENSGRIPSTTLHPGQTC